ncbi:elongation factor tu [Culex quinquefasciatus]|uniref:Elongation factor tu n=1 Tax=Culex quinquefasciatus TaxID=7176 RepID=B0W5F8_CULQU|nr:elongation factor tu [Culex quinquefasciatus]|eukprot:XP_001843946.1 elongation factor tu [Culex quinquefasciatus]
MASASLVGCKKKNKFFLPLPAASDPEQVCKCFYRQLIVLKEEKNKQDAIIFSFFFPVKDLTSRSRLPSEDFQGVQKGRWVWPRAGDNIRRRCGGTFKINGRSTRECCCARAEFRATFRTTLKGRMYLLAKNEGGRSKPLTSKYIQQLFSKTWNVPCRVDLAGQEMLMPGDHGAVRLTLLRRMVMSCGQTFTIRENGKTVSTGLVTKVLDSVDLPQKKLIKLHLEEL